MYSCHLAEIRPQPPHPQLVFHLVYRYRDALDSALQRNDPEIVQAMLEELVMRGGLLRALGSREPGTLAPLLSYLKDRIAHPDYSRLLLGVSNIVLDVYGPMVGVARVLWLF